MELCVFVIIILLLQVPYDLRRSNAFCVTVLAHLPTKINNYLLFDDLIENIRRHITHISHFVISNDFSMTIWD